MYNSIMKRGKEMKKLIEERIKELEKRNTESRDFVKLLDEKEDKEIIENEKTMRKMRMFAILELGELLEKADEE